MEEKIISYVARMSELNVETAEKFADNALDHSMRFTREVANILVIAQTIVNIGFVIWLVILTTK